MKKSILYASLLAGSAFLFACGGGNQSSEQGDNSLATDNASTETTEGNPSYDPNRGEGKFTSVDLGTGLNVAMAEAGKKVSDVKCSACHKLTDEKLVGPGWKGVTTRRTPVWIMNFITNTDAMLNKDPAAQAQLEICLVRMPNQSLSDEDARSLLEYMRQNDGVK